MSSNAQNHDAEYERLLNEERFILEVTERICAFMDEKGISRSELAQRLGKTKGYVSQLLSGGRNLTMRTVADVSQALGANLHFQITRDRSSKQGSQHNVIWRDDPDVWKLGPATCGVRTSLSIDSFAEDDFAVSQAV